VNRHQRLERTDQLPDLGEGLALHRGAHHRRGRLADRTALARDLHVAHCVRFGVDVEVQDDFVTAQRIEPLDLVRRRNRELAAVPRRAVVVEDDLSVQVFEAGHLLRS